MNRWWYEGKTNFLEFLSLDREAAHVHFGLFLFLLSIFVFRKSEHVAWWALGLVAVLQAANEGLDALDWISWTGGINWSESLKDMINTLFWPSIFSALFTIRLAQNKKTK